MGYYINQNSKGEELKSWHKVQQLVADGAVVIERPPKLVDDLVCVVINPHFDSAAYIYDDSEFADFNDPHDKRERVWLQYEHAATVSGFTKANNL